MLPDFLYNLMRGLSFTEMASQVFSGDPFNLSKMFDAMINFLCINFDHKNSGTNLSRWIPSHVHLCRSLIHNSLSEGTLEEVQYVHGNIVNEAGFYTISNLILFPI